MMMKQTGRPASERIAYGALLVAMQIVLGNLLQIPLPTKQFNLGFLPIALAGAYFGAPTAVVVGALGDFFGAHLFPAGPYFPGFTLTAALVGLLYGLILYGRKASLWRLAAACAAVALCNLFLNSYWLTYFVPKGYWVLVGSRALTYLIDIPLSILVIYLVLRGLGRLNRPPAAPEAEEAKADGEEGDSL